MSLEWWPNLEEYNPNISKEKWLEILDDRNLTTEQNLYVLACMYDFGCEATCKQLSLKYGESYNTYNSGSSNYAERIVKANICEEPPFRENGNSRWWPVLFVGHDADKETPGSYVWKLRDELKEACKEYGIEKWLKESAEKTSSIHKLNEYKYPTDYYRMQMNDANGNRIAETMLDKGVITASIEYAKEGFAHLKRGDVILVHKGSYPIALVAVIEKQNELDSLSFGIDYSVDLLIDYRKKITDYNNVPRSGTFFPVQDKSKEIYKFIDKEYLSIVGVYKMEYYKKLLKENKNIILHGAPGTGKTYLAKEIAKAMGCSNDEIGFCQFHPSYDYTDFVEGLRPISDNVFERKDGVFKEFCYRAGRTTNKVEFISNFDVVYDKFIDDIIDNDFELETLHHKKKFNVKVNANRNLYAVPQTETATYMCITREMLQDYIEAGKIRDWKPYVTAIGKYFTDNYSSELIKEKNSIENKNYVFIIDEINRGELSKIFGELFFSIDPGYRGFDEDGIPKGLVKTQYQNLVKDGLFKDGFFIPDNVYIIGTMNDIDRSVESMDFAMRRRFTFIEVTAEESAKNMNITGEALEKMNAINKVISKMPELGKSYCIGAAYFKDAKDLQKLWDLKISSLVYEYLRGIDNYTDEHKDGEKFDEIKSAYDNPETVA